MIMSVPEAEETRTALTRARRLLLLPILAFSMFGTSHVASASNNSREAGYAFAKRLNIVDTKRCAGPSAAFIDGCRAYASQLAARQTFMPTGAYNSGNVGNWPYWYAVPIYSPIRQFE